MNIEQVREQNETFTANLIGIDYSGDDSVMYECCKTWTSHTT